jgi:hypothetical protein
LGDLADLVAGGVEEAAGARAGKLEIAELENSRIAESRPPPILSAILQFCNFEWSNHD